MSKCNKPIMLKERTEKGPLYLCRTVVTGGRNNMIMGMQSLVLELYLCLDRDTESIKSHNNDSHNG